MEIDDKLNLIFSNVLTEIISTISGFSLEELSGEGDSTFEEMTGVLSLCGKENFIIFISANENDMRILCSYIIGVPVEEVTKNDIEDTLCELVNMTAGSTKLRLSGSDYKFSLSSPFVIKGNDMSIAVKNKTRVISKIFGNGEISFKLKVIH